MGPVGVSVSATRSLALFLLAPSRRRAGSRISHSTGRERLMTTTTKAGAGNRGEGATPSSQDGPASFTFDAAVLKVIQRRIAAFQGDPIPLIEGTPSTSRIKLPADPSVRPPRTAAVLIPL